MELSVLGALSERRVPSHPVGVMSYETRFASVWSTKRGIDATSSVCISGKSVHIALSRRYAARRTARISSSSALISLFSKGRLARRVSAGVCAFRFINSICMSWLVPGLFSSSIAHVSPLAPSRSSGGTGSPSSRAKGSAKVISSSSSAQLATTYILPHTWRRSPFRSERSASVPSRCAKIAFFDPGVTCDGGCGV